MKKIVLMLALLGLSGLTLAHTGTDAGVHHGNPFVTGLLHPYTGMDHLLAMLAVGVWSTLAMQKKWAMPLVFAVLLLVGGLIGMRGIALPAVETMIALSLLALGALIAARVQLSTLLGALLVGGFAVFHGVAHGSELPATQAALALSGMVCGTLALHLSGMALGHVLQARTQAYSRILGGGIALMGMGFLAAAF